MLTLRTLYGRDTDDDDLRFPTQAEILIEES